MTPIHVHDMAQRLIDLHGANALNIALKQSLGLLDAGHLLMAASMARVAALISEVEVPASFTRTLALG